MVVCHLSNEKLCDQEHHHRRFIHLAEGLSEYLHSIEHGLTNLGFVRFVELIIVLAKLFLRSWQHAQRLQVFPLKLVRENKVRRLPLLRKKAGDTVVSDSIS